MEKIIYSQHLLKRLKERKFPKNYPRKIYKNVRAYYFDKETNHNIAVAKLEYANKLRNLVIAYDIIEKEIHIITIYPISDEELKNKLQSGRWIKK